MSRIPLHTLCLGAALMSAPLGAEAGERVLTGFDGTDGLSWETVNDGVMGGRSRGGYEITSQKTLLFSGETSLQNKGGFSSIRTRRGSLNLEGSDGLALRVRGDGRTYKVSLGTADTSRWISYWAELPTIAGEWVDVRIPFGDWVPTTFGRKLQGPRLNVPQVDSIGFMIYDKQAGPFSLEVARIAAYQGSTTNAESAAATRIPTIVEAAQGAGTFKTLLAAAQAAGLVEALSGPGPLTVFAPTDAAFSALPQAQVAALFEPKNRTQLRTILSYHVVPGELRLATLLQTQSVQTLAGQRLAVGRAGGAVQIGAGTVVTSDLACSNGVIQVIDRVLLPELSTLTEVAEESATFRTLLAAAKATGLHEALAGSAGLTVFAPTDEAFAALPAGTVAALLEPRNLNALKRVLQHHVIPGVVTSSQAVTAGAATTLAGTQLTFSYDRGLRVAGAPLVALDLPAVNGVIHVVGQVLLPPGLDLRAAPASSAEPPQQRSTGSSAARLIESAIERGAPLFNDGQEEACVAVYELAAQALLDLQPELLSGEARAQLRRALVLARPESSAQERAWALRRSLDFAYHAMQGE